MVEIAAGLFVLLTLVVCGFQVALVFGAPWGEFTLGGRWRGELPIVGKCLASVSIVLLVAFGAIILARARLVFPSLEPFANVLAWIVVGYCALGSVANAATRSARERAIWLPVVFAMLVLSSVVAAA